MIGLGLGQVVTAAPAAGPIYDPATMSGLVGFWEGPALTGGGSGWTDQSANANTQVAAAAGAAFLAQTGLNGLQIAYTDGTRWRQVASLAGAGAGLTDFTAYLIIKPDSIAGYRGVCGFDTYSPSVGFKDNHPGFYFGGDMYFTDLVISNNTGHLLELSRDTLLNWNAFLDGVASAQNPKTAVFTAASLQFTCGGDEPTGVGDYYSGEIAALILINRKGDSTDRANIADYSSRKWGV